jgi:uncharacterized membrane protein
MKENVLFFFMHENIWNSTKKENENHLESDAATCTRPTHLFNGAGRVKK